MLSIFQITSLLIAIALFTMTGFVCLALLEQFGFCNSRCEKLWFLMVFAMGATVGAFLILPDAIALILPISYLCGGAIQIWYKHQ